MAQAFQYGLIAAIGAGLIGVAFYMRANFLFRSHETVETWRVSEVTSEYNHDALSGYSLWYRTMHGQLSVISTTVSQLKDLTLVQGDPIRVRAYSDLFGYQFMDSMILIGHDQHGSLIEREILK